MEALKVLFVDDETELVSAVVERLQLRGISADGETGGAAALERISHARYDVVVLDVKMPGIGGLDVVRRLRLDHPGIKVVLLTGHGSAEDAAEGERLGTFAYLQKPVNIDALVSILRRAAALEGPR